MKPKLLGEQRAYSGRTSFQVWSSRECSLKNYHYTGHVTTRRQQCPGVAGKGGCEKEKREREKVRDARRMKRLARPCAHILELPRMISCFGATFCENSGKRSTRDQRNNGNPTDPKSVAHARPEEGRGRWVTGTSKYIHAGCYDSGQRDDSYNRQISRRPRRDEFSVWRQEQSAVAKTRLDDGRSSVCS